MNTTKNTETPGSNSTVQKGYEAIILAGGLGTRLRSVVNDVPKCMAPVNGIPFIHFIVEYLRREGVGTFIFSLGYKHEIITAYLDTTFPTLQKKYSIEEELLGTGGAIKKACELVGGNDVVVLNGDTMFNINITDLFKTHQHKKAACTIALKEMKQFSRYGSVQMDANDRITAFNEKQYCEKGLINGGIYVVDVPSFLSKKLPAVFSFEKDYLEKFLHKDLIIGEQKDYYFIDIGIPEDYKKFEDNYNIIMAKHKYQPAEKFKLLGEFFEALISDF
jgi:D-glycero-alpha-D-manno-heptose 1-phosphate guanylyltransferase